MKSNTIFRMLVILFFAGITTLLSKDSLTKEGDRWIWKSKQSFEVSSGGKLEMKEIRGDVSIDSWDKNEVLINGTHYLDVLTEAEARAIIEKGSFKMNYSKEGNFVVVNAECISGKSVTSKYEIFVPRQFKCEIGLKGGDLSIENVEGEITANVGGGDVSLSDILGPLHVNLGGGDLSINNCQKNADINLGGGDLEIEGIHGSVNLNVGGGDVSISESEGPIGLNLGGGDLEISQIEQDVTIKVGGGDVEIEHIKGQVKCEIGGGGIEVKDALGGVRVKTSGGDIEAIYTTNKINPSASIIMESDHGDIEITVPETIKASLNAEVERVHPRSEETIESDFPLRIVSEENGDHVIKANGNINGGGIEIQLKTQGGDISIRKFKD